LPSVSNKPGRNEPCPCGSGTKYKRCCLSSGEAAARDRAQRQPLLDDDAADFELDEYDEEESFVDVEDDWPILDVRDLTRVCYTRGFVNKFSELQSGTGVRVTEWEAPRIPWAVLDILDRELPQVLEERWGNPKIDDPIQVDIIDLETDTDVLSIEVFNRAISLVQEGRDPMQGIERLCHALEAAASGQSEPTAEPNEAAETVAVSGGDEATAAASAPLDIAAILKEHRRQGGTCALCGEEVTRRASPRHLALCAPAHDETSGPVQRALQIRATAPGLPAYWLDIEVRADVRLDALDSFLRRTWLECCGHLSAYDSGIAKYFSRGYDFDFARGFTGFGGNRTPERSMRVRVGDAMPRLGEPLEYEYDFGSTTRLQLKVTGERIGRLGRPAVRLLARNTAPAWPCALCGAPASLVCALCVGDESAFACAKHRREHACGEEESFRPVVNSPRMGVCGYTGEGSS
jgi:hypothetical protein